MKIASLNLATSKRDERQSPLLDRLEIFDKLINKKPWFDILVLQEVRGSHPLTVDDVLDKIQSILGGSEIWSYEDRYLLPATQRSSHRTIFWNKQKLVYVESKIVVVKPEYDKRSNHVPNLHPTYPMDNRFALRSSSSYLSALTPAFVPGCNETNTTTKEESYSLPSEHHNNENDDEEKVFSKSNIPLSYFIMPSLPQPSFLSFFPAHFIFPPPIYFKNFTSSSVPNVNPSQENQVIKPCTFPYFVKSTFYFLNDDDVEDSYETMKPFTVINVHAPMHQGMRERYWKEISYHLNKFPKSIAIGDFNKFDDHRTVYDRILHTKLKTDLIPKEQITFVSWEEDRNPKNGELWRSSLDGCVVNNKIFKGYVDVLDSVQPPRLSDHFFLVASLFWA